MPELADLSIIQDFANNCKYDSHRGSQKFKWYRADTFSVGYAFINFEDVSQVQFNTHNVGLLIGGSLSI